MYYGKWSFREAYNLPIQIRRWFLEKLTSHIKEENAASKAASQGRDPTGGWG